jgi:hypothetical protein
MTSNVKHITTVSVCMLKHRPAHPRNPGWHHFRGKHARAWLGFPGVGATHATTGPLKMEGVIPHVLTPENGAAEQIAVAAVFD